MKLLEGLNARAHGELPTDTFATTLGELTRVDVVALVLVVMVAVVVGVVVVVAVVSAAISIATSSQRTPVTLEVQLQVTVPDEDASA
jgi:cell division protein FtsX